MTDSCVHARLGYSKYVLFRNAKGGDCKYKNIGNPLLNKTLA